MCEGKHAVFVFLSLRHVVNIVIVICYTYFPAKVTTLFFFVAESFDCYYTVEFSSTFSWCFCVNSRCFHLFLMLCWKAQSSWNYLFKHSLFFFEIICVLLKPCSLKASIHQREHGLLFAVPVLSFLSVCCKSLTFYARCSLFIIQLYCALERRKWALDCYCDYCVVAMESVSDHTNLNQIVCLISCLSPWISKTCHLAWGYRLHINFVWRWSLPLALLICTGWFSGLSLLFFSLIVEYRSLKGWS